MPATELPTGRNSLEEFEVLTHTRASSHVQTPAPSSQSASRDGCLPAELLYSIICQCIVEYIDHVIAGAMDDPCNPRALIAELSPAEEALNPVAALLHVSHQFRDIVRKVLSQVLDLMIKDNGYLEFAPWRLVGALRRRSFALYSGDRMGLQVALGEIRALNIPVFHADGLPTPYNMLFGHTESLVLAAFDEDQQMPEDVEIILDNTACDLTKSFSDLPQFKTAMFSPLRRRVGLFLWSCQVALKIAERLRGVSDIVVLGYKMNIIPVDPKSAAAERAKEVQMNFYEILIEFLEGLRDAFHPNAEYERLIEQWGYFPSDVISPVPLTIAFHGLTWLETLASLDKQYPSSDTIPELIRDAFFTLHPHFIRVREWQATLELMPTLRAIRQT